MPEAGNTFTDDSARRISAVVRSVERQPRNNVRPMRPQRVTPRHLKPTMMYGWLKTDLAVGGCAKVLTDKRPRPGDDQGSGSGSGGPANPVCSHDDPFPPDYPTAEFLPDEWLAWNIDPNRAVCIDAGTFVWAGPHQWGWAVQGFFCDTCGEDDGSDSGSGSGSGGGGGGGSGCGGTCVMYYEGVLIPHRWYPLIDNCAAVEGCDCYLDPDNPPPTPYFHNQTAQGKCRILT